MKVLLTGANGYVGTRLLQVLVEEGHEVIAFARMPQSVFIPERIKEKVWVIQGDLLKEFELPKEIDAAYYLVHSMCKHLKDFDQKDRKAAKNFIQALEKTNCRQLLYLTGLISSKNLSKHLESRLEVENILKSGKVPTTVFRSGIIIGSGSASFEIIRDLIEKLPILVAPKWVNSHCQPIGISDVLFYLSKSLGNKECLGKTFDIGGPDVLTYKEMLYEYAKVRKLHRLIISVPILTPNLSSYWLVLITSTNFFLARSLVDSMTVDAVCQNFSIKEILPHKCLAYEEALLRCLEKIQDNAVISSWYDSWTSGGFDPDFYDYVKVPDFGCYKMKASKTFSGDPDAIYSKVYHIGGSSGYFYMNWAWHFRALIDRCFGGAARFHRRTRREELFPGNVIGFWRVIQVDKEHRRLILFAEMKLPGEAWLEFHVFENQVEEIATFRPRGLFGRLYWWLFYPIHLIMFPGMLRKIVNEKKSP